MRATLRAEVRMRGDQEQQAPMWSYISPEQRIPQDHPLRPLRTLVDVVLKELSPRLQPALREDRPAFRGPPSGCWGRCCSGCSTAFARTCRQVIGKAWYGLEQVLRGTVRDTTRVLCRGRNRVSIEVPF